ncbi:MAG: flippase-like domain-containing protein [Deltaproteobacteria bacterium]|nr:flippase-like domain-containing protein [Deltaproteobacteria bacterium]
MTDEHSTPERHMASHVFNVVVMILGAIGLVWMLNSLGWTYLTDAIANVGWWFPVILALDVAALCCDAAALQAFMRPEARMVSYFRVLGAQASGRAINVLTPTGALGEPTKLAMLMTHAPRDRVLSSLVLLNLGQFYLSVIVIVLGTPIMFLLVDIPHSMKVVIGIGFAVIVPLVIALGVMVHRGALTTLVGMVHSVRLISKERADRWKLRVGGVDKHIRELQENRSHGTWKGILWVMLSKLMQWTATLTLLHTAGVEVSPALIVGVLSVGVLIQWIAQIVPMGLGIADGGNYALFDLVGATGAYGVVITVLNRARSITVAIVGLCAMAVLHTVNRLALSRMRRKLDALRERAADVNDTAIESPTAATVPAATAPSVQSP